MSLNISALQLRLPGYADELMHSIARRGLDPAKVTVEVTEHALLDDVFGGGMAVRSLHRLRREGIRVSLDDFGTGYASLSRLIELPADELKIDQSFIRGMLADERHSAIVSAVLSVGVELGLDVVAEGVETRTQRDVLSDLGTTLAQGWFFGKPQRGESIPDLVLFGEREVVS